MQARVQELLKGLGPGKMSDVAYDTAWVARLGEVDWEISSRALAWLNEHQLPDGSWGAERPYYYHDRLISTLAAMIALTQRGRRAQDHAQIERGSRALETMAHGVADGLRNDPSGPTVGFEMIAPTLVGEAEKLGIIQRHGETILERLAQQRKTKLGLLKGKMVSRHITAAFSAEMAGLDGQHMLDLENLQESNGSVGHSPSATAYYAKDVRPGDEAALNYLRKVADHGGGTPDLIPFDVFETCVVLWNFSLLDDWDEDTMSLLSPLLSLLKKGWQIGKGIGLSIGYSVPDGDNTSFVYAVLARFGEHPDIETVLSFEEKENFRAYHLEAHSSTSLNVHALGALRQAGYKPDATSAQKVLNFLRKTRVAGSLWYDKWNLSPYYTTAHAIITCAGYVNDLAEPSVQWLLQTQRADGSWGYQFATAEETSYCLQALCVWKRHGGTVPKIALQKAAAWLRDHMDPPYPQLWIGKGLYTPELIVRSAILSALLLSEKG